MMNVWMLHEFNRVLEWTRGGVGVQICICKGDFCKRRYLNSSALYPLDLCPLGNTIFITFKKSVFVATSDWSNVHLIHSPTCTQLSITLSSYTSTVVTIKKWGLPRDWNIITRAKITFPSQFQFSVTAHSNANLPTNQSHVRDQTST